MRNLLLWWLAGALACGCAGSSASLLAHGVPRDVSITRGDASVTICGTWDERALEAGAP